MSDEKQDNSVFECIAAVRESMQQLENFYRNLSIAGKRPSESTVNMFTSEAAKLIIASFEISKRGIANNFIPLSDEEKKGDIRVGTVGEKGTLMGIGSIHFPVIYGWVS